MVPVLLVFFSFLTPSHKVSGRVFGPTVDALKSRLQRNVRPLGLFTLVDCLFENPIPIAEHVVKVSIVECI